MNESYPLSPVQRRLWEHAAGRDSAREAKATFIVGGAADAAISAALADLAARWEILRTRFPTPPGFTVPVQAVGPDPVGTVTVASGLVRMTLPGLTMDRRGFGLLGEALARQLAGEPAIDAPQYPDVAGWLDDLATGPEGEAGRAFWESGPRDAIAAVVPVPPSDDAEAAGPVTAPLPPRLAELTRRWDAPLETVVLGAWHLLLQRLSGQRMSQVAFAADGREQEALQQVLGPLTRWLPGELEVDPASPLDRALAVLAASTAERLSWQDCTPGGSAPFGFRYEPALTDDAVVAGGLVSHGLTRPAAPTVRLVECHVLDEPHALRLVHTRSSLRVEGEGAAYVLRALMALLEGLTARPETPAGALPIMSEQLLVRLVTGFNATARYFPATDMVALFEAACDRNPAALALRSAEANLQYATLDARANAVARGLSARGIGPESRVGLLASRSPQLVVGLLGILKAGAAFVPLDPANPPARRDWIAADAGLTMVLHSPGLTPPEDVPALVLDDCEVAARPGLRPHPESIAYVLHTSGSTGRPKGVAVTHRGLTNYLAWAGEAYRPECGRGVPMHTSPAFDLTLTALLLPLTRGQFLDLLPEDAPLAALAEGLARGADWGLVKLTPSHLKALGSHQVAGGARRLVVGGEALFGEQLAAWAAADPDVSVVNEFGPTETVVGCCVHEARAGGLLPGPVPIGSPIANMTMLVLDTNGQAVPPGVAGEGWIGGVGVARGYLGRPGLTADRFRPDPAGPPGARVYRTGDLVRHRWAGGLDYLGRVDDQIKVAGHRVEPAEVEAALLQMPEVDQAAVLQDGDRLLGFVVPADKSGEGVAPEALRTQLATTLPGWMVPARLRVIPSMPLAPSGKADRATLLTLPEEVGERTAPRDAREAVLVAIWENVLGRPVGVHDDFFQLGGDSIRGLQIVARARRAGLSLRPDAVFHHPTVARQAAAAGGVIVDPEASPEGDWFTLHPIQARFLATAGAEPWHEAQSLLLRPRARPDPVVLTRALAAVQRRHGMLRATFGIDANGTWRQRVDPLAADPRPETYDLRAADAGALQQVGGSLKRRIDLANGPIWRSAVLDLPDGPAVLLAVHHLVIDRVSWGPLLDDLARAIAGEELDPPPPSFASWVAALRTATLPSGAITPTPEGSPTRLTMVPTDDPEGDLYAGSGGRLDRVIEVPSMQATVRQADVLAALARALIAWAGLSEDTEVVIEVEHHGRDARGLGIMLDVSETVGWFTAIAPVALRGDTSPAEAEAALAVLPANGLALMVQNSGLTAAGADALLNHLGVTDLVGGGFELLPWPTGPDRSRLRRASHAIELVTAESAGLLHCAWHHTSRHHRTTIERLAALFGRHLTALAAPPAILRRKLPRGKLEAIERRHGPVQAVLPSTPLQQGMLYHSALDPAGGAYVEQTVLRIDGLLDPAALRAAWTALVRRHAALRTLFVPDEEGLPAQIVLRMTEPDWVDQDWRGRADRNAALAALLDADRAAGFDPQAAPPLRFRLLQWTETEWCFLWTRHHALLDGWSLPPLFSELVALAEGQALPPPPDPVAISDYLAARDAQADRAFWRARLAGAEPTPLGARATASQVRATARLDRRLTAEPLLAFARQAAVTPATLVAAAWGVILARDAGRKEAVFAMTSSGRSAEMPGAEGAIGLFLTTLPVRLAVDLTAKPAAFLRRLQADLAAARAHEHCPPQEVLDCAGLSHGSPLATSLLTYENYPADPSLSAPRPAPRIVAVETVEQSSFPLSLLAGVEAQEMVLSLRFDPARFGSDDMASLLARVADTLVRMTTASSIGTALPPVETAVLEQGPALPHSPGMTLHTLVLAQALRTPEAPAVLWENARISYADLIRRAHGVAAGLRAAGVRRGDVVGVMAERSEPLLPALLGTLLAGAAWCPLEPDQPPARLAAMVADARVGVALCGPGVAPPPGCVALPLDIAATDSGSAALMADDIAYVMFTSGSTGRPKGVAVPHGAIVNRLGWMQRAYPIGPGDVVLQKTPLGFDVCVWELFWPLLTGAAVAVAPPHAHRDPEALAATMRRHKVDVLHFVPSMLRAFLDTPGIERGSGAPRLVFTSGEALTPDLVAAWRTRFGGPLHNLYGPTEAAVDVTAWTCGEAEASEDVPIGRPMDNVTARVLDDTMQRVPVGVVGALWLGGVQIAAGYVNAPALTADAFRPDPFGPPGARLYRSGDRAAWRSDGALLYQGRADTQVKLRGVRIETGEIEAALLGHPSVGSAVVRLVEDRLVAWVAPGLPNDLDAFLASRLPVAMRPSLYVPLPRLPLTASGKVDRRALTLPDAPASLSDLPRGLLEVRIAALAATVLGRRPGPEEDLFALGLHSIAAVRLLNLLRRELGAAPALPGLYAAGTVAGLAAALASDQLLPTPLVRLRGGVGLPLVLVHPVGGDITCFLRLSAKLDRPVYAFQARGLLGGTPSASIEAMATDYCAVLHDAVPGPIALAGYSMGCAVAFEMARRLGRQAPALVLLDGSAAEVGADLTILDDPDEALARARAGGLVQEGFGTQDAMRVLAVAAANQRALSLWRPTPAELQAVLVRTTTTAGSMGWRRLALGGLAIRDIAATHETLVDEPHVAQLALIIEAALGATVPA